MAWLTGWSRRKTVTITGEAGAGTNYQVNLSIGDASAGDFHLKGNCTSFPNDIQVTDNDQTTTLDYWVEDLTIDPITMWVEVADSLEDNVDICVYYSKSGESSASNGTNTFLFFDDFEDAVAGDWTTAAATVTYNSTDQAHSGSQSMKQHSMTSAAAYISVTHSENIAIDIWHLQVGSTYRSYFYHGNGIKRVTVCSVYYSLKYYDKTWNDTGKDFTVNTWHKVTLKNFNWTANTFDLYMDDDIAQAGAGMQSNSGHKDQLGVTLHIVTAADAYKDDVVIRKYTLPEPAFGSAGAEEALEIDISITDSGISSEFISILANIPVADSGIGSEVVTSEFLINTIANTLLIAIRDVLWYIAGAISKNASVIASIFVLSGVTIGLVKYGKRTISNMTNIMKNIA